MSTPDHDSAVKPRPTRRSRTTRPARRPNGGRPTRCTHPPFAPPPAPSPDSPTTSRSFARRRSRARPGPVAGHREDTSLARLPARPRHRLPALAAAAALVTGLGLAAPSTALAVPAPASGLVDLDPFAAVDPWIGTAEDFSQNKGNAAYGNTWPGPRCRSAWSSRAPRPTAAATGTCEAATSTAPTRSAASA
ncbi:hypothetical protein NKG05_09695 [Oerskovia sp. M15]